MTGGRRRRVAPHSITPLHEIHESRRDHLRELMRRMRRDGWQGRPILVELISRTRYQAWTGTHRLAAARRLPLRHVPVVLIDQRRWLQHWGPPRGLLIDEVDGDRYLKTLISLDFDNIKNALCDDLDRYVAIRNEIGEDINRYITLRNEIGVDVDRYIALRDAGDTLAAAIMHQEIELNLGGDAQRCL